MAFDLHQLTLIREKYGGVASWALWSSTQDSDTSDTSIFDLVPGNKNLERLHSNIVFVALNISGQIKIPFGNFHGGKRDFMLRDAVSNTLLEGAYMTDLIKDYEDKNAASVVRYFKNHPKEFEQHVTKFRQELADVCSMREPTLIALGNGTFELLGKVNINLRIHRLTHYSAPISKLKYRNDVLRLTSEIGKY